MAGQVATFHVRGAGGAEFEFDELDPTTARGENLAGQIHKGDLVVLDKKGGQPIAADKVEEMLAPFGLTPGGNVVGDPIIEGPGPAVPVDGSEPDRPQLGDAIPIVHVEEPPPDGPSGDSEIVAAADAPDEDPASFVPSGTAAEVLDWVRGGPEGDDPTDDWEDRARAALEVEQAKDKPGKGLAAADAPDEEQG
jgi:hypothetical protein